jgi:hypothetical protein
MYFFIITGYIISAIFILFAMFYFIRYSERSHMREWARQLGIWIFNVCSQYKLYLLLCKYILQSLLIFSDCGSGFLEGAIGIREPMVQLVAKKHIDVQTDIQTDVQTDICDTTNEKLLNEIRKIIIPPHKLIQYDHIAPPFKTVPIENQKIMTGTNISDINESVSIFKKINPNINLAENDNISLKTNDSKIDESSDQTNRFIDSPTSIKRIIRNKNIKTNIKRDGNKIKVSISKNKMNK